MHRWARHRTADAGMSPGSSTGTVSPMVQHTERRRFSTPVLPDKAAQLALSHVLLQDPHSSASGIWARLLEHLCLLTASADMQVLRDVKHFIKDYRGEMGTAQAGAAEPMARLLVQVQLPQKGPAQPPALPPAVKQQASSPRAAVAVSGSSPQ